MNDALNTPVKRARREVNTSDMAISYKQDVDLDEPIVHGESFVHVAAHALPDTEYLEELAFMEEPVTIRIAENSRSDVPETHVAVSVNGRGAEIQQNGKWLTIGWLPIGQALTTKRKYVEVLARSSADNIKTQHDDATTERPRNLVRRTSSQNYPISVLKDDNPRGNPWLQNLMASYN